MAGGGVSQQPLTGARATSESWKVVKAAPREAFANTTLATSAAPARVSRTMVGSGSSARVVTMGRDSGIAYDAREHRFVNGAAAPTPQSASSTSGPVVGERSAGAAGVPTRSSAGTAAIVRVPANSARMAAPPSRATAPPGAMAPPPARPTTVMRGTGGGFGQGASSSRGTTGTSAPRSAPSAGAAHPSGGGRPH